VFADIRNTAAARLAQGFVLLLSFFPPEIFVPGARPSHEPNCLGDFQRLISKPISEIIFNALKPSIPSISVRSTPVI
jgi:hypothetical protein